MTKFVIASVLAHVLLGTGAVWLNGRLSGPRIDLNQKPITASLVRLGQPRDEKLLPRVQEAPPPTKEERPSTEKTSNDTGAVALPVGEKRAPPKKKEDTGADSDRQKRLASAFSKAAVNRPPPTEGALDGDALGEAAQKEGEQFFALLKAQVQRHYDVSSTVSENERLFLKAVVRLNIGTQGELLNFQLAQGSGNALFDAAVLSAVKKAAPFGAPPVHLRSTVRQGMLIEFKP